jgi:hypothetical protein
MTTFITERDVVKFHSPAAYKEATDMIRFYRARAKAEEAWKVRDDTLEEMTAAYEQARVEAITNNEPFPFEGDYINHQTLERLELKAVRWEKAADKLYAQANECDCKPDASEVCASCKAYLNSNAGEELAFGEQA